MLDWITIVALYALGMSLFHFLGGLSAAAEALERWGAHSTIDDGRRSSR